MTHFRLNSSGVCIAAMFYVVAVNLSMSSHSRVIGLLCVVFGSGDRWIQMKTLTTVGTK